MTEYEYYLNQHHDAIFLASDGRYKTHLTEADGNRKLLARKSKQDLENLLVNYYKKKSTVHSVMNLKDEFISHRKQYVRNATTDRDDSSYTRFFDNSKVLNKDIRRMTLKELSDYRMKTILRLNLNSKGVQRLQSLLNAVWDYAVMMGYTEVNLARNLRSVGRAFFTPDGKLDLSEVKEKIPEFSLDVSSVSIDRDSNDHEDSIAQYYTGEEQSRLIRKCYET